MKNTVEGIKNRYDEQEDQIKDKVEKNSQAEQKNEKRLNTK